MGMFDVLRVGLFLGVECCELFGGLDEFSVGDAFGGALPFVEGFSFAYFAWVVLPPFFECLRVGVGWFLFWFVVLVRRALKFILSICFSPVPLFPYYPVPLFQCSFFRAMCRNFRDCPRRFRDCMGLAPLFQCRMEAISRREITSFLQRI